jgi:hypothetical protein
MRPRASHRDDLAASTRAVIDEARDRLQHLMRAIARVDRDPFQRSLAEFLTAAPDPEAIRAQAIRFPDRYVQSVTQLARLAGYRDTSVSVSITADLSAMSDAELEMRVRQVEEELARIRRVELSPPGKEHPDEGPHPTPLPEAPGLPGRLDR